MFLAGAYRPFLSGRGRPSSPAILEIGKVKQVNEMDRRLATNKRESRNKLKQSRAKKRAFFGPNRSWSVRND